MTLNRLSRSHRKRELLGTGSFATVYAEWDFLLGRAVAVKELDRPFADDAAFVRAYLRKAESFFDMDSRYVLATYRAGSDQGPPAIVRELADETLEASILLGPLPPGDTEEVLHQALLGLQAMHGRGIAHGAIKPQNIFRLAGRYKLGDFGPALDPALGFADRGAPASRYAAPELLHGETATPASDFYSLGMVAYELILGRHRFEELIRQLARQAGITEASGRESIELAIARLHSAGVDLPALHGFPPPIARTIHSMLQREAGNRLPSAAHALEALGISRREVPRFATESLGTRALETRLRPPAKPPLGTPKLKRALGFTLGGLLAASALATVVFIRSERLPDQPARRHNAAVLPAGGLQHRAPQVPLAQTAPVTAPSSSSPQLPVAAGPSSPPPASPATPTVSDHPLVAPMPAASAAAGPAASADRRATKQRPPAATAMTKPRTTGRPAGPAAGTNATRASAETNAIEPTAMPRDLSREIQSASYGLGALRGGQRAYADVDATFAEFPEHEGGIPCVTTANGDRKEKGTLSFHLDRGAKVYVGFDHENKSRPSWLNSFSETGESWSVLMRDTAGTIIGTVVFDVFTRSFGAGEVTLGSNVEKTSLLRRIGQRLGRREPNMYLVCVDAR